MSGKRYYSYQGYSGHRRASRSSDGLFGWTVFTFLLIGFVLFCWMGSYYIFSHPEKPSNYRLLKRLHKIDAPQRFEITAAPRGEFLKPGQLLERYGSMPASELRRCNEKLLKHFLQNYHQIRELVPYAVGTYRVVGTMPLSSKTFAEPGLVALLQAVEQPEVLLEQLFTTEETNLPSLKAALSTGQEIKLEKPLDLSAVIHVERLSDNRIRLTTMPLLYGTYGSAKGQPSFSLEPPAELNIEQGLPVMTEAQIRELPGGRMLQGTKGKGEPGSHLTRIAEEASATQMPTPEPRVAKAIPAASATPALSTNAPAVARAIPVNAQPVLPAIPVNTPAPATAAVPPVQVAQALPVATPLPAIPAPTALTTNAAKPALPAQPATNPAAAPVTATASQNGAGTNAISAAPSVPATPSEAWPVYTPGQMPRGRLLTSSEIPDIASRGIGGERHYLEGRFTVTASGNGRAVLRPQGALAGMPVGPSAKVRVIVEFPAGAIPPTEGNSLTRDNLRPFQITSVKRGDDGQINVYAREVTRGQ